jgi:hypothetical protein
MNLGLANSAFEADIAVILMFFSGRDVIHPATRAIEFLGAPNAIDQHFGLLLQEIDQRPRMTNVVYVSHRCLVLAAQSRHGAMSNLSPLCARYC